MLETADSNWKQMSESEWQKLEMNVSALQKDMEQNKEAYSQENKDEANKMIGQYRGLLVKKGFREAGDMLKDAGKQLEGILEAVRDSL